jgi:hypothetical protein
MKLTFPTTDKNDIITVEDVAMIESSMMTYFYKLFIAPNNSNNNNNNHPMYNIPKDDQNDNTPRIVRQPLQFHVDVADSILIGNIATITAQVSFLYEASSSAVVLKSQQLAETFTLVSIQDQTATTAISTFSTFTTDPSLVTIFFTSNENDDNTIVLKDDYRNNNGSNYTSKEVALIVVTVFLSIVLLIVSSVLLHITGGWIVCTNAMSNCLFEEIEDDDDVDNNYYRKKTEPQPHQQYIQEQPTRTFPMQQSQDQGEEQEVAGTNTKDQQDDDEDTNFLDVESAMTSVLPTSASGLLGVARNKDAVAIHTMMDDDDDDDEESNIYGDGMTPVSRSQMNNNEPLGITSMRKLQPMSDIDHKGGFSSGIRMLQNRLLRSASKKEMTPS